MNTVENFFTSIRKHDNPLSNERLIWETLSILIRRFGLKDEELLQIYIENQNVIIVIRVRYNIIKFAGVRNISKYGVISYWIRPALPLNNDTR